MLLQEILNCLRMLLKKCLPHNSHSRHHAVASGSLHPLLVYIQSNMQAVVLHERCRHKGLGQKSDGIRIFRQHSGNLSRLRLELQRIIILSETVLLKKIPQRCLGCRSLACQADRFTLQIGDAVQFSCSGHKIKDSQCIDIDDSNAAVCLLIENRCNIGGYQRNIELPLYNQRKKLVCSRRHLKFICILRPALVRLVHQA